jgi:methyl-accepting chemotaxis protein
MLSESVFQTLRMSMNYGDQQIVQEALSKAKNIDGINNLKIHKSQSVIDKFDLPFKVSNDKDVVETFSSAKDKLLESNESLRLLKPLKAESVCISCHTNAKEGDILGVIDISYDLNELNQTMDNYSKNTILYLMIMIILSISLIAFFIKKVIFDRLDVFSDRIEKLIHIDESKEIKKIVFKNRNDEISKLSVLFNQYIEKIEKELHKEKLDEIEKSVDKALDIKIENTLDMIGTPAAVVDTNSTVKYYNREFLSIFDEVIDANIHKAIIEKSLNIEDIFESTSYVTMIDFKEELLESDECATVSIDSSSFSNNYAISIDKFEYENENLYMILLVRVENVSNC